MMHVSGITSDKPSRWHTTSTAKICYNAYYRGANSTLPNTPNDLTRNPQCFNTVHPAQRAERTPSTAARFARCCIIPKNMTKKDIVTESRNRMKAFGSALTVNGIPYRLHSCKLMGDTFYTFTFFPNYCERSLKIWNRICISIPDETDPE